MSGVERVVYQVWTGDNPMSSDRRACFESGLRNINVPVKLVTPSNLQSYVVEGHPLHPAYKYLTPTQKSDYLRNYFMHFHGGGYADIKWFTEDNNWDEAFDILDAEPGVDVVGTRDPNVGGANMGYARADIAPSIIVVGFMVARPMTEFTSAWYAAVQNYLTVMLPQLERYAGGHCPYPIPWTGLSLMVHSACREVSLHRPDAIRMGLRTGWDTRIAYR